MKLQMSLALPILLLGACQAGESSDADQAEPFDAIAADERIFFLGTEPFWNGEIEGGEALYATPENQAGTRIDVARFAGNNGLAFTGSLDAETFDMMVTPGECSDAMSDRTYPYTVTLMIGDDQREGCAWTDSQPFDGPQNP